MLPPRQGTVARFLCPAATGGVSGPTRVPDRAVLPQRAGPVVGCLLSASSCLPDISSFHSCLPDTSSFHSCLLPGWVKAPAVAQMNWFCTQGFGRHWQDGCLPAGRLRWCLAKKQWSKGKKPASHPHSRILRRMSTAFSVFSWWLRLVWCGEVGPWVVRRKNISSQEIKTSGHGELSLKSLGSKFPFSHLSGLGEL